MVWQIGLLAFVGGLLILLAAGIPVAFSFLIVNIVGVFFLWGRAMGFSQLVLSIYSSVTMFSLLPVILFVMMGEVLLHSGLALKAMDVVDKWLGRLPGRLSLVAVASATIFSSLSGSSMGTTAMLGSMLVPEMERRGYKKVLSIGSCMSGGLAILIPPSILGVILGAIAQVSIGQILIGGIIPGILLGLLYCAYIVSRCLLQPSVAPLYDPAYVSLHDKIIYSVKYLLPLGSIIFAVMGLIFLGIATPTESAAMGALVTFLVAVCYRRLKWEVVKDSVKSTLNVSCMMFMILTGSLAFSQILAYSGATEGLVKLASTLPIRPILIVLAMQIVVLILGTFMEQVSIMMITLPIFMPIVRDLGFNDVWFAIVMLINLEISMKTPPFGFLLFVMKGVAPIGTTMGEIYKATFPFLLIDVIAMVLIIIFPKVTLWLPGLM